MNNTCKRIILFVLAIPGFTLLILFVPHANYLWSTLLLSLMGFFCGVELRAMLAKKTTPLPVWTILFPTISPFFSWGIVQGWFGKEIPVIALMIALLWAFSDTVFLPKTEHKHGITHVGNRLLMLLYPGFFIWWIDAITMLPYTQYALLIFMLSVYLNDAGAWFFGILIGKHRGLIPASPNKSVEGFIAGVLVSTLVVLGASFLIPKLFPHPTWKVIVFGITVGITTILGDLFESLLKRAVGVKDSGKIILGRGGMLDSIDSLLFTAPVFVLFIERGI